MKKKYTDAQSYFQDWAQAKKKEVQNMEESMRGNPLYQKETNPIEDDETWSERFHFILRKGLSEKEWKAYQKGIRQDRLRIWAMFINENPDYDYHYFLILLKFKLEWIIFYWENLLFPDFVEVQIRMDYFLLGELWAFSSCGTRYQSDADCYKAFGYYYE